MDQWNLVWFSRHPQKIGKHVASFDLLGDLLHPPRHLPLGLAKHRCNVGLTFASKPVSAICLERIITRLDQFFSVTAVVLPVHRDCHDHGGGLHCRAGLRAKDLSQSICRVAQVGQGFPPGHAHASVIEFAKATRFSPQFLCQGIPQCRAASRTRSSAKSMANGIWQDRHRMACADLCAGLVRHAQSPSLAAARLRPARSAAWLDRRSWHFRRSPRCFGSCPKQLVGVGELGTAVNPVWVSCPFSSAWFHLSLSGRRSGRRTGEGTPPRIEPLERPAGQQGIRPDAQILLARLFKAKSEK
jgi:hypothetical protein